MSVKIDTRTFFFNADTDFLAYYKNHTIKIDEDKKVKDLLLEIQSLEPTFKFKKTATLLQINGIFVKGTLSIKKAVELFGTSWTIEPISTFRAVKDLIIDDKDFIQKHEILEKFADEDDFKYYKSLIVDYYSSVSLKYNRDYFGDSMFIYASYLIDKYPAKKDEILAVIDDPNGIWLYEKECNQYPPTDLTAKIEALKSEFEVKPLKGYTDDAISYYDKAENILASHFNVEKDEDCALETILDNITLKRVKDEIKNPYNGFNVAFYAGSFDCDYLVEVNKEAKNLIKELGANVVNFATCDDADGFDIAPYNEDIAFKKAGNIALDAYDMGADILVVDNRESHFMMDQSVKKCEKATGRDIKIPILNISQFVALAIGITDKERLGLDAHKIEIDFI